MQPSPAADGTRSVFTAPVLSHFQTAAILQARSQGNTSVVTSMDLGMSATEVTLHEDHVGCADGTRILWEAIERITAETNGCFFLRGRDLLQIRGYSALSGRSFSLMPTSDAPAMIIAGFPMHRIKNITPCQAAALMVRTIAPCQGKVLDTATGLGYTAIALAKSAEEVITVELDPVAQQMARLNPWSQQLFHDPRITQIMGDSTNEIKRFKSSAFSCVFHDPPTISLAGDLYSRAFYAQAFRVLKPRGRMFHYVADPDSASGNRFTTGAIRRLREAGFQKVVAAPEAFGVVAYK